MATYQTQGFTLDNSGKRIVVDPDLPDRGPSAHRSQRRQEQRHPQRGVDGNDVARTRSDPEGPRPARRVGVHRAHLRRLHGRARARVGARGRGRAPDQDPEEREHHPQPDARDLVLAGSPGPLLPPARARLGRRRVGAQGGPEEDLGDPAEHLAVAEVVARVLPRRAEPAEEVRRERPARHLRQRLLGQPRVQAAAGSEPPRDDALPRGARLPEGHHQDPDDLRRQEPAPELAGRRRPVADQCRRGRRGRRGQHGLPQHGGRHLQPHDRVHRPGLHPRPARDRRATTRIGRRSAAASRART